MKTDNKLQAAGGEADVWGVKGKQIGWTGAG